MHDAKFDTHSADTHCTEQPAHSQSNAALRAQQPAEVTGRRVNNSATLLASLSQFGSCKSSPVHIGALHKCGCYCCFICCVFAAIADSE